MELREYIARQIADVLEAKGIEDGLTSVISEWEDLQEWQRVLSLKVADGLLIRIPELYNIDMNRNTERQIQNLDYANDNEYVKEADTDETLSKS